MLAELVPQQELGKVYGLLAILDASLPFLGKEIFALSFSFCKFHSALPLANPLWDATLDTMPGAFCLVNAGVNNIQKKDFIIYERLWDSLPASILLCGSSNVNTIYGQPRTSRPIIGMFCLLCAHRQKLL